MSDDFLNPPPRAALRLILRGRVQGLGVRPTIVHVAELLGVAGVVTNTDRGVEIEVEGDTTAVALFADKLSSALPRGTRIDQIEREEIAYQGRSEFAILRQSAQEPPAAQLPQDMVVCADCLGDIANESERRYRYPFTSCTACGPRYTMIREMPYERTETTMGDFTLCKSCLAEYTTPGDRRFHAQSTACPECGPKVWCVDSRRLKRSPDADSTDVDAIPTVVAALLSGHIVAVRGLGGYQLLVDATNESAVGLLRERKHRPAKPLALLIESVDEAEQLVYMDAVERSVLSDRGNPIVLLNARPNNPLADGIHPGLDTVGLMLPTTPLHAMLAQDVGRPLVCTSANREGEPLEYEVAAAEERLADICDLWLHHNRPIARPIDDSVVRVIAGRPVTIRLARGLAPLTLDLPSGPPMLAVGGHLKGAVAWSNGKQAVLSPHIGDMEGLGNRERFVEMIEDAQRLYRFESEKIVHDQHPDYFTTQWSASATSTNKPISLDTHGVQASNRFSVQHHHAHVVAAMLEHGWLDRQVLGVAWDGTGYGSDGTIWGGEFLLATATAFERVASLRPFRMPGGEKAVREPWRVAAGMLAEIDRHDVMDELFGHDIPPATRETVLSIYDHPRFSPKTTSAGRLFDAATAIILEKNHSEFDGQPAMLLEAAADRKATGHYALPVHEGTLLELDWRSFMVELLTDRLGGAPPSAMAMRFHRGLAAGIVEVCRHWPEPPVVLTGGVFQNRLLTELVLEQTTDDSRPWGPPGVIPPGDGGLAAGQLAVASAVGCHHEAT